MEILDNKNNWVRNTVDFEGLNEEDKIQAELAYQRYCHKYEEENPEKLNERLTLERFIELSQQRERKFWEEKIQEEMMERNNEEEEEPQQNLMQNYSNRISSINPIHQEISTENHAKMIVSGDYPEIGTNRRISPDNGAIVLNLKNGNEVVDWGHRIDCNNKKKLDDESVEEIAKIIQKNKWTSIKVEGTEDFKKAVAKKCLMMEPPVYSGIELNTQDLKEINSQIFNRAVSKVPKNKSKTENKQEEALKVLQLFLQKSDLIIKSVPTRNINAQEISRKEIASRQQRGLQALDDAFRAQQQFRAYKHEQNRLGRIFNPAVRQQLKALKKEMKRASRKAKYMDKMQEKHIRQIIKASEKYARQNEKTISGMVAEPTYKKAISIRDNGYLIEHALKNNDPATIASVLSGKIHDAVLNAESYKNSAIERAETMARVLNKNADKAENTSDLQPLNLSGDSSQNIENVSLDEIHKTRIPMAVR